MTESDLLAALIHHCGGELHIDRICLEQIAGRQIVADLVGNEIILRLTTNRVQIFPKCQDRTQAGYPSQPASNSIPIPPSSSNHSILSDEKLKALEQEQARQRNMREWKNQTADILSQMPVPSKGQ